MAFASKLDPANGSELERLIPLKSDACILDLRQPSDFEDFHLPRSVNIPFVYHDTPNPFQDPKALESLWNSLESAFTSPTQDIQQLIQDKRILVLCYDGDSARVATSVLRAKGYEADNLRGGFAALKDMRRSYINRSPDGLNQENPLEFGLGSGRQPVSLATE